MYTRKMGNSSSAQPARKLHLLNRVRNSTCPSYILFPCSNHNYFFLSNGFAQRNLIQPKLSYKSWIHRNNDQSAISPLGILCWLAVRMNEKRVNFHCKWFWFTNLQMMDLLELVSSQGGKSWVFQNRFHTKDQSLLLYEKVSHLWC